jgi:hypothetical protein
LWTTKGHEKKTYRDGSNDEDDVGDETDSSSPADRLKNSVRGGSELQVRHGKGIVCEHTLNFPHLVSAIIPPRMGMRSDVQRKQGGGSANVTKEGGNKLTDRPGN